MASRLKTLRFVLKVGFMLVVIYIRLRLEGFDL